MKESALIGLLLLATFSTAWRLSGAAEDGVVVAGKVTDEQKLPVKHALVVLTDRDGHTSEQTHTDHLGQFSLNHAPSREEKLQIVPPRKTGLAQAILTDIPGEEGRHVLVSARKGFLVQGRVVFNKQPLKHVSIAAQPQDGDTVHGGGETVTDGHGAFQLILTPGQKTITVSNIMDSQLVAEIRQSYRVTEDATMPDINVPLGKTAGNRK